MIVYEGKANGYDMRASLGISGGQATGPRRLNILAFLFLKHTRSRGDGRKKLFTGDEDKLCTLLQRRLLVERFLASSSSLPVGYRLVRRR